MLSKEADTAHSIVNISTSKWSGHCCLLRDAADAVTAAPVQLLPAHTRVLLSNAVLSAHNSLYKINRAVQATRPQQSAEGYVGHKATH
jgi:hypothetical protein